MKTLKIVFVVCLVFLHANSMQAQNALQIFADSIAKNLLEENKGGALQIGILYDGKQEIFSYGEVIRGSNIKPGTTTIFEIGQVTQVFTASLFALMSIHGDINPDESIGKYLPVEVPDPVYREIVCEPVEKMNYPKEDGYGLNDRQKIYVCRPVPSSEPQPILVCYLGTHTSGLPQRPSNMKKNSKNPYSGYSKEDLYEFLRTYDLPTPVGFNFHYSDLDMAVLGHIMELKSGKDYASLVDSCVFAPCGMHNTYITMPDSIKKNATPGYNSKGKQTPFWDFQIMAPAAGIKTTIGDMMKFLSANLNGSRDGLTDALNYTHNARIRFKNKIYGDAEAGLGWLISPLGADVQYVWQEGVTGGFAAFIGFVESAKYGVVVLSNQGKSVRGEGKKMLEEISKRND